MMEGYTPQPRLQITSLEAVKALSDNKRLAIINAIQFANKPLSVKQIAETLKVDPRKLYYHINMLEEHGLIVVTETRIVSNLAEKYYHLGAYEFDIAPSLFTDTTHDEATDKTLNLLFDKTKSDFIYSVQQGLIEKGDKLPNPALARSVTRLNQTQVEQVSKLLSALLSIFNDTTAKDDETTALYSFTYALFPMQDNLTDDKSESDAEKE
ncbi:MAG: helix-turn-helix domain-containing protein [Chloroflexi bacterium]|nr:helix-turn-helix domain-containing protein [Chloroflexota bacterium]